MSEWGEGFPGGPHRVGGQPHAAGTALQQQGQPSSKSTRRPFPFSSEGVWSTYPLEFVGFTMRP